MTLAAAAAHAALAVLLSPALAGTAPTWRLLTVPSRPGVTVSFLLVEPATAPAAAVVAFVGHGGVLGLSAARPRGARQDQFLYRSAELLARQGLLVALVDAPSDRRRSGLFGFRTTAAHARDAAAVVAAVRRRMRGPVWLAGTSYGALSAANAAARLGAGVVDGLVLTSAVVRPQAISAETVFSVDLARIRVPLLVVRDADDACPAAAPAGADAIVAKAVNAPRRRVLTFRGGPRGRAAACEPLSPHGFLGLEPQVTRAVADWMKSGGGS